MCLSDLASVMALFDKKMATYRNDIISVDIQIHFLFCNAIFCKVFLRQSKLQQKNIIDECEKLVRDEDTETFSRFANASGGSIMVLIRTARQVFGPAECHSEGIKDVEEQTNLKSRFCSQKCNRSNNVFDNAFTVVFHKHHIINFLDNSVSHSNMKLKSILLDIKDERMVNMMRLFTKFTYLLVLLIGN